MSWDENELERMRSHFSERGPVAVAYEEFLALESGDFDLAWSYWTAAYRRRAAEHWVDVNLDELQKHVPLERDEMVNAIEGVSDSGDLNMAEAALWAAFTDTQMTTFREAFGWALDLHAAGRLGAASATRIIGPDLEVVLLTEADPDAPRVYDTPTPMRAIKFTMRLTSDGWMVEEVG